MYAISNTFLPRYIDKKISIGKMKRASTVKYQKLLQTVFENHFQTRKSFRNQFHRRTFFCSFPPDCFILFFYNNVITYSIHILLCTE